MGWRTPPIERKVFLRNSLASVAFEVRYNPILRINERAAVTGFQDLVRHRFSGFDTAAATEVELGPLGIISVTQGSRFVFKTPSENEIVALGNSALLFECKHFDRREAFVSDAMLAVNALTREFSPIQPTRIGLRYVNQLDLQTISKDLGREVLVGDVVAPFLVVPFDELVSQDDTLLGCEVRSSIDGGMLTFRYGQSPPHVWRLDFDRYAEKDVSLDNLDVTLTKFSDDIYSVFMKTAGPALLEWMNWGKDG
jgi:uncharacterized protein (TIGR04255 family)